MVHCSTTHFYVTWSKNFLYRYQVNAFNLSSIVHHVVCNRKYLLHVTWKWVVLQWIYCLNQGKVLSVVLLIGVKVQDHLPLAMFQSIWAILLLFSKMQKKGGHNGLLPLALFWPSAARLPLSSIFSVFYVEHIRIKSQSVSFHVSSNFSMTWWRK